MSILKPDLPSHRVISGRRQSRHVPLFSVTIALFDVENYFGSTISSLEDQTIDRALVEYIVVDDGSTDSSLDIARAWAERDPSVVLIGLAENSGVARVRRTALAYSRGEWVTAVDPDDVVAPDYFKEVARCIEADEGDDVALYSTRCYITNDSNGLFRDTHPLGGKYRKGNRAISLVQCPNAVEMGATCFLRRQVLVDNGLTFEPSIKPTFEDGHLSARYLCHWEEPILVIVATAHYYYRKRESGNSLVQSGWAKEEKFFDQVKYGYIDALEYAQKTLGEVPDWLACQILYDLVWYFKEYERMGSKTRWLDAGTQAEFMALVDRIVEMISLTQLDVLTINKPNWVLREALELGLWAPEELAHFNEGRSKPDGNRVFTLNAGPFADNIEISIDGEPFSVAPSGVKTHEYYGRLLMTEYSLILPDGDIELTVNGEPVPIIKMVDEPPRPVSNGKVAGVNAAMMRVKKNRSSWEQRVRRLNVKAQILGEKPIKTASGVVTRRISGKLFKNVGRGKTEHLKRQVSRYVKKSGDEFKNAWILLDHQQRADDNAEHLYRYLLKNRPDIKAYFMLEESSRDWPRLAAEGFHLVGYGTVRGYAAAQVADLVISSDAIAECMYIAPRNIFGAPKYQFVFLQHGVTLNDISGWLQGKKIELITAATKDEVDAFVWKYSRYFYTQSNIALTGFARFDPLYERREEERRAGKDLPMSIFVMPTWRRHVYLELKEARGDIERSRILNEDSYLANWIGLLSRHEFHEFSRNGRILFAVFQKVAAAQVTSNIIIQGNSGGGFAALHIASLIPDSIAVAHNPQTDLLRYHRHLTQPTLDVCLGGDVGSSESLKRLSIAQRWKGRKVKARILANTGDEFHVNEHVKPLQELAEANDEWDLDVQYFDWGPGHVPPPNADYQPGIDLALKDFGLID